MIATKMRKEQYEGNLRIYCHSALVVRSTNHSQSDIAEEIYKTFWIIVSVRNAFMMGIRSISGLRCTFDILSTKVKQFWLYNAP